MNSSHKQIKLGISGILGQPLLSKDEFNPNEWIYTVTVENGTSVIFDELTVVYTTITPAGSVVLAQGLTLPGQKRVFTLCPYSQLLGFVVGLFWYDASGEYWTEALPESGFFGPDIGSQHAEVTITVQDLGVS